MKSRLLMLLSLGIFLAASSVSAQTLFVDQATGDDMNDGLNQGAALATVSRALELATSGAIINVGPGVYSEASGESMPLSFIEQDLTILGAGPSLTVFDGEGKNQVLSITSDQVGTFRMSSLMVLNGASPIGAGLFLGAPGVALLEDLRFQNNAGSIGGAFHAQINRDQDTQITILDCEFLGNTAAIGPGVHIQQNGAGEHDVLIERSSFSGHNDDAIGVSQNDGSSVLLLRSVLVDAGRNLAVSAASQGSLTIYNSTFVGSNALVRGGPDLLVVNSIVAAIADEPRSGRPKGFSSDVIRGSGGTVRDSIVIPLNVDGYTIGPNVIDDDPIVDAEYRLTKDSPARDVGDDSVVTFGALDIDREARIQGDISAGGAGGLVDLGADEFDPDNIFASGFELPTP